MADERQDTRWISDKERPLCRSALVTNGRVVWCSFVGGTSERPCSYGIKTLVKYEEAP